ncbi:hypothetical protein NPIL_507781 [Nephila pilipes]|uniref:Uncharacterized protein n=1 Tax=Nephila pilipes TaxID=299642 RepID=A0A8X6NYF4_NEPPI|nr:hypothetical protein NPIL_507781 [Nephila pilipes]
MRNFLNYLRNPSLLNASRLKYGNDPSNDCMGNLMNKDCLFYSRNALLISSEREYIKSPHAALYYRLFLVTRFGLIPRDFFRSSAMKHLLVYLLILTFMTVALQAEPAGNEQVKNGTKTKRDVTDVSDVNKIRKIMEWDGRKKLRFG